MSSEIPTLNPARIFDEVLNAGEDWADKKSAYEALNDNTKSLLAAVTGDYMDAKESKAAAETRALASPSFREHVALVSKARRAFLLAQVRYDSLKLLAELRRTQESTRRAEMRL